MGSVFQRQTKSEYSATHQVFFSEFEKKKSWHSM